MPNRAGLNCKSLDRDFQDGTFLSKAAALLQCRLAQASPGKSREEAYFKGLGEGSKDTGVLHA